MKKLNIIIMMMLLAAGVLLVSLLGGCDELEDFLAKAWVCIACEEAHDGFICFCANLMDSPTVPEGEDPADWDLPDPPLPYHFESTCSIDVALKATVSGHVEESELIWAALERNGTIISYSPSIQVIAGTFAGFFLSIPLDGLQLDDGDYSLSVYATPTSQLDGVGLAKSSVIRNVDAVYITIPSEIRAEAAAAPSLPSFAKLATASEFCLFINDTILLAVNNLGDDRIQILEGQNNVNDIKWEVKGNVQGAGTVNWYGTFTALAPAPEYGDCYVKATDTVRGLSDSVFVTIVGNTTGACDQVPGFAGIKYNSGDYPIGAACSLSTRYGSLCNQTDTSVSSFGAAWHAVYYDTSYWSSKTQRNEDAMWAEVGYIRYRPIGKYSYTQTCFYEMMTPTQHPIVMVIPSDTIPEPQIDSTYEYKSDLTVASGTWSFYLNAHKIDSVADPTWVGRSGQYVCWAGEVKNSGDDMPGTSSNPCQFRFCKVKRASTASYVDADWYNSSDTATISQTDPAEYKINVTSYNSFDIWDANPH